MEIIANIFNVWDLLTIFVVNFIFYIQLGSEYASV